MRKHKSVVSILLAIMMVFTFMPAMAFANTQSKVDGMTDATSYAEWATDGHEVKVGNTSWKARRDLTNDGNFKAYLDDSTYTDPEERKASVPWVDDARFFDMTGAELEVGSNYGAKGFEDLFEDGTGTDAGKKLMKDPTFTLYTPSYLENKVPYGASAAVTKTTRVKMSTFGWTAKVYLPDSYDATKSGKQTVELTAVLTPNAPVDGTKNGSYFRVDETVVKATVTVNNGETKVSAVKFFKDKVSTSSTDPGLITLTDNDSDETFSSDAVFAYDGAAHKVVTNTVEGYSVSYATLNESTGKYEGADASCPEVKNVGESKKVRATITWTTTTTTAGSTTTTNHKKNVFFQIKVTAADNVVPKFVFDGKGDIAEQNAITGASIPGKSYGYAVLKGTEYDPTTWVVPYYAQNAGESDADYAKRTAKLQADAAEWANFFKDFYTIEKSTKVAYPDYEFLTIKGKTDNDFTPAELKALKTKYAQLLANYGAYTGTTKSFNEMNCAAMVKGTEAAGHGGNAYVFLKPASTDYEVTFTKAITSKTFKGSKTTKKGKLKKNQTIQFTAEAANGAAVVYKLVNVNTSKISIDKATGKLTLKKGLAKGTYEFKIKAYVPNVQDEKSASEIQNVTIKIKK